MTIPYFELPVLHLPFDQKIDIFGVVSAAGVFLGAILAAREARNYAKITDQPLRDVVPWAVGIGLTGGHFFHIFLYHPELFTGLGSVVRIWDGLSSMGGVVGALTGIFIFFRKEKIMLRPYLDPLALGTATGWTLARLGCFLVHDHPGVRTDFFLAVDFPAATYGGPRHDLGLYDMVALGIIAIGLNLLKKRKPPQGTLMGVLALVYSVQRFFSDFLRASDLSFVDRRYGSLTPAQFTAMGMFAIGVWLLWQAKKNPVPAEAGPDPEKEAKEKEKSKSKKQR